MKNDKVQNNISTGWQKVKLGNISNIYDGTHQTPAYTESGVPFYSVEHVTSNNFNDTKFVSEAVYEKESKRIKMEKGDILMTRIGDVGTAKYIDWNPKASFYVSLALIKCKKDVNPKFIHFVINSDKFKNELRARTLTVAFPNKINLGDISKCNLYVPIINEQNRIVSVLETWDKAIEKLTKKIEFKKNIKKGLMQRLLTGELRLPSFNKLWNVFRLGDISKMSSGGTPLSKVGRYYNGNILWVSIADMTKQGKYITDTEKKLTEEGLQDSAAKVYPVGTILYAMYASIGECGIATREMTSSQAILGIEPDKNKLNNIYLYYFLTRLKDEIKLLGQQGTQSNLNAGIVKDFKINLPVIEEQNNIVNVLQSADNEIDLFEKKLTKLKEQKNYLLNNLITGAIRTPETMKIKS